MHAESSGYLENNTGEQVWDKELQQYRYHQKPAQGEETEKSTKDQRTGKKLEERIVKRDDTARRKQISISFQFSISYVRCAQYSKGLEISANTSFTAIWNTMPDLFQHF